jgi:hypothetical protein
MEYNMIEYIRKYKDLIENEPYDFIVEEMLVDLKGILLEESKNDIVNSTWVIETFFNIKHSYDVIDELNSLETKILENSDPDITNTISNIKANFNNKHQKIMNRDDKWLKKNKKKILSLDYTEIELEVLSDYKVTFEQLLNRHNIFDKLFVNSADSENLDNKLRRFEDKNENLKNGLDNYFRTGTSRREIGLRKVAGDEAKLAVENMVAYCESFLAGKKFLEEKLNNIIIAASDEVKESLSPIEILREALEDDKNKKEEVSEEKPKKEEQPKEEKVSDEEVDTEVEKEPVEDKTAVKRGSKDRQVGIAVLLTVAEERYFDYINILKGLLEE